ncbi:MAG TPA: response regulator [Caulobacteraceae bacterium]|nr:response regulator [Caulobacteraceae bacterium]
MKRLRVMVVEDEGLIALMIEDMLEDLGCEVVLSAAGVGQALAWIEAGGEADAALLDVNLGGEAVFPVAEALARRGVPFAFTTGYGEAHDPRFRGAPLLSKPIKPDRLEDVLAKFAGEA